MIEGVTAQDFDKFKKILNKAKANIIARTEKLEPVSGKAYDDMIAYINQLNKLTLEEFKTFLASDMQKEYLEQYQDNKDLVDNFDNKTFFDLPNTDALKVVYNQAISEFANSLESVKSNYIKELNAISAKAQNDLITTTGAGQLTGKSRKAITKDLVKELKANDLTAVTITNSKGKPITYSLEAYSEIIYRRSSTKASLLGAIDLAKDLDTDLLKLSSHSNPSPICAKHQGKIVSITGQTTGYTSLKTAMTWFTGGIGIMNHKYCRHKATPYFK